MKRYKVIGLMSGTSLDGLDLAYCHIQKVDGQWTFSLERTMSVPYSESMRAELKNSIAFPADQLLILHNAYGTWLGKRAQDFIQKYGLEVDFIASHGHTVHHQPQNGFTFQIGSGQHLANASGQRVICDFRSNDVALGGQGAPLVPIGDALFFGQYDFCLNLGGISNISFDRDGTRLAYDIGLANMILNHLTRKKGLEYDKGGLLARAGQVNPEMLDTLNALEYYRLPLPKSVGYEWFLEKVVPIIEAVPDSLENLLCTSVHHVTDQIALQVKAHSPKENNRLLVTGGGALNDFLMETLRDKLGEKTEVIVPPKELIEFKEALVFALMGVLRIEGETNALSSVTGARENSSSGIVYEPFPKPANEATDKTLACMNCGSKINLSSNFCPNCGQKSNDGLTMGVLFGNILNNYLSVDARLLRSLGPLMLKPGFLPRRFVDGKRSTYMDPIQFYLFVSIIFFFLFSLATRKQKMEIDNELKRAFQTELIDSLNLTDVDPGNNKQIKELMTAQGMDRDAAVLDSILREGQTNSSRSLFKKSELDSLIKINAPNDQKLAFFGIDQHSGAIKKFMAGQALKIYERQGSGVLQSFYDVIPVSVFFLLPIFAILLQILYIGRGRLAHHMVFSFYFFTFMFVVLNFISLLNLFFTVPTWVDVLVVLSTFIYLVLSLGRFYGQRPIFTFLKAGILSFTFMLVVLPISLVFMLLISLLVY